MLSCIVVLVQRGEAMDLHFPIAVQISLNLMMALAIPQCPFAQCREVASQMLLVATIEIWRFHRSYNIHPYNSTSTIEFGSLIGQRQEFDL